MGSPPTDDVITWERSWPCGSTAPADFPLCTSLPRLTTICHMSTVVGCNLCFRMGSPVALS